MATYQVLFTVTGDLSAEDDVAPWYICSAPYGLKLLGVDLAVKTPCQTVPIIIDIEKSTDGISWASIFGEPYIFGAHDGPENSANLVDNDGPFTESMEGLIIERAAPHAATGTITDVISSTTLTASFGDWDTSTSDQYLITIAGGILPGEYIGIGGTPTVTEINQGDLLRLDIEQAGTAVKGSDLTVSLRVRQ